MDEENALGLNMEVLSWPGRPIRVRCSYPSWMSRILPSR